MSRTSRFSVRAAALVMALALVPAAPARPATPPPADISDTLTRILAAPDHQAAISRFIGAGRRPAAVIARRARALIRGLRARREGIEPTAFLGAIGQISMLASRAFATTAIMGFAVGGKYRPENVVVALDFGPPDGAVMPGFERVTGDDPRIEGEILMLHRPNTNALLSDGLAGIEKISFPLDPGEYRVILITQNLGDPAVSRLPFGREVRINGVPMRITRSAFVHWRYQALLAGGRVRLPVTGGYRTGTLPAEGAPLFARQQGGAVILEAKTTSDKLIIELSDFAGARSYLTGLLVERLGMVSDFALSASARRGIVSLRQRLELEAEVLAEAARAIGDILPAAGPQTPLDDDVVSQDR